MSAFMVDQDSSGRFRGHVPATDDRRPGARPHRPLSSAAAAARGQLRRPGFAPVEEAEGVLDLLLGDEDALEVAKSWNGGRRGSAR
jgi:hypothetical protein